MWSKKFWHLDFVCGNALRRTFNLWNLNEWPQVDGTIQQFQMSLDAFQKMPLKLILK